VRLEGGRPKECHVNEYPSESPSFVKKKWDSESIAARLNYDLTPALDFSPTAIIGGLIPTRGVILLSIHSRPNKEEVFPIEAPIWLHHSSLSLRLNLSIRSTKS